MTIEVGDKVILIPDGKGGYLAQKPGIVEVGNKVLLVPDNKGGYLAAQMSTPEIGDKPLIIPNGINENIVLYLSDYYLPFTARYLHGLVRSNNDKLFLFGGSSTVTPTPLNDVWASFSGAGWKQVAAAAEWTARYNFGCTILSNNTIIIAGGATGSGQVTSVKEVWKSEDGGETWTQQTAAAGWGQRNNIGLVALSDNTLILAGGVEYSRGNTYVRNDVWKSEDEGANWTKILDNSDPATYWKKRWGHTLNVCSDDSLIITGGNPTLTTGGQLNDVWMSTDGGATWSEQTAAAGWTPREHHACAVLSDDKIVLVGGYASGFKNDVWYSSNYGVDWTQLNNFANGLAYHRGVSLSDDSIIIAGGYKKVGFVYTITNNVWKSTDSGVSWTQLL